MSRGGRRDRNGFESWGGYMAAKKAKLEDQFKKTALHQEHCNEDSESNVAAANGNKGIFDGVAIYVNGYTGK